MVPTAPMPADVAALRRGAIAWGVFPFAAQFPLRWLDEDGSVQTLAAVDDYAAQRRGRPTSVVSEVKLRPVLLLHDGATEQSEDIVVLRINSVRPRHRESASWLRIEAHEHPFFVHLPQAIARYRLPEESIVSLTAVATVHKNALLEVRGGLSRREMRAIDERLIRVLSLELGPYIAQSAHELLRRAGIAT
jgi:mRNA-degrading endonuclease toxin of MazEF toxin-antitoxin module